MDEARVTPAWLAASLLASLICISAIHADDPRPPLLQIGQIESVQVDGRISEGEWDGATRLDLLVGPDSRPAARAADIRVAWDSDGLAILWELAGDPTFKRRDRDAEIWRDDSVEVRLQRSEDAAVCRFAINAGGSTYDARDGDASWDPLWRALALRGTDGWRVEMHIPFASFEARPDDALRANLIVNGGEADAAVAAWTVPSPDAGEGLGFLRLADTPSHVNLDGVEIDGDTVTVSPRFSGPATVRATLFEGETEVQTLETTESASLQIDLPHPGTFRLRLAGTGADGELSLQRELALVRTPPLKLSARKHLLSAREIEVTIDGAGLGTAPDRYVISAPGAETVEVDPGEDRIAEASLDLTPCAAGDLTVTVAAMAGREGLASETLSFTLPPRPDWAGSNLGKHGRLIEPWTPVRVTGNKVHCRDRVYDFGDRPLPVGIRAGGVELLASPISLRAHAGSSAPDWGDATFRWLEETETHAVAAITARSPVAEARVRATCRYDGLMTFEVKIDPVGDRPLSEVSVEIPIRENFARYMQVLDPKAGLIATSVGRGEHLYPPAPMVWLTNRERGVQWLCGAGALRSLEEPGQALAIRSGRKQTSLHVTMLDRELLPGESFETGFTLQATPVRPMPEDRRNRQTVVLKALPLADGGCDAAVLAALGESHVKTVALDDEDYRPRPGGLGEEADALLVEFARLCHESGLRLVMVIDDDLTRDPVWEAFRDEVAAAAAAEGERVRPCPASAWADYVVEAAEYAMSRYDADGIHLRGGLAPLNCGLQGDGDARGAMGARELMMRLRTVVKAHDPDAILTVEQPQGAPAAAIGYADGLVIDGVAGDGTDLSVDELAARGGTGAFGTAVEVALPVADDAAAARRALGLALLHDAALRPVAPSACVEAAAIVRRTQEQFDVAAANWRAWWAPRPLVTTDTPEVLVSTWWHDGEVLAVVANRSESEPVVELSFNRDLLELGPWLWAVDVLSGQRVPQVGEVLRMRMSEGQTSLIHVRTRHEREVEIDE